MKQIVRARSFLKWILLAALPAAVAVQFIISCDSGSNPSTGALTTITVTPDFSLVLVNGTQQLTATGKDASGNTVTITPVWSIVSGSGSVSTSGLFTASAVPETSSTIVQVTSGTVSARVPLLVASAALPSRYFKDSVQTVFDNNCVGCHNNGGSGWDATGGTTGGLDLTNAYATLVNKNSFEHTSANSIPRLRVKPGLPDSSYLYHKISMDDPGGGFGRMPLYGSALSDPEIATIKKWILNGAPLGDTTTH